MLAAQVGALSLDNSESPVFTGKVVAALACKPEAHGEDGKALATALVEGLGVADIDTRQPRPLKLETS